MASEKDATCENDPNFAIVCAFMHKFAGLLEMDTFNTRRLRQMIENTDDVTEELKDLHVKLLRKCRKTVQPDKWERAVVKFCHTYSSQDAWEVERFGYKKSSLPVKLRILKEILECQFDKNNKFKNAINGFSAKEIRSEPLGHDKLGNAYWVTLDEELNLRVYQEHQDEETWKSVATSRDELAKLIEQLKGNEVEMPSLVGLVDEDSSSNSNPATKEDALKSGCVQPPALGNIKIRITTTNGQSISQEVDTNIQKQDEQVSKGEVMEDPQKIDDVRRSSGSSEGRGTKRSRRTNSSEDHAELIAKRPRPTLLVTPTKDKSNKYANLEDDDDDDEDEDDDQDDNDDDEDEDEDEDVDDTNSQVNNKIIPPLNKNVEEGDEDDEDDDEEDDDDDEEEDEEDDEEDDGEVSDEIEEPVMHIRGEGSGRDCKGVYEFSEPIEEDVLMVFGEGIGAECEGGNPSGDKKDAEKPLPVKSLQFFFGAPDCLKLSPIRKVPIGTSSDLASTSKDVEVKEVNESVCNRILIENEIKDSLSKKSEEKSVENSDCNVYKSQSSKDEVDNIEKPDMNIESNIPLAENPKDVMEVNSDKAVVASNSTTTVESSIEIVNPAVVKEGASCVGSSEEADASIIKESFVKNIDLTSSECQTSMLKSLKETEDVAFKTVEPTVEIKTDSVENIQICIPIVETSVECVEENFNESPSVLKTINEVVLPKSVDPVEEHLKNFKMPVEDAVEPSAGFVEEDIIETSSSLNCTKETEVVVLKEVETVEELLTDFNMPAKSATTNLEPSTFEENSNVSTSILKPINEAETIFSKTVESIDQPLESFESPIESDTTSEEHSTFEEKSNVSTSILKSINELETIFSKTVESIDQPLESFESPIESDTTSEEPSTFEEKSNVSTSILKPINESEKIGSETVESIDQPLESFESPIESATTSEEPLTFEEKSNVSTSILKPINESEKIGSETVESIDQPLESFESPIESATASKEPSTNSVDEDFTESILKTTEETEEVVPKTIESNIEPLNNFNMSPEIATSRLEPSVKKIGDVNAKTSPIPTSSSDTMQDVANNDIPDKSEEKVDNSTRTLSLELSSNTVNKDVIDEHTPIVNSSNNPKDKIDPSNAKVDNSNEVRIEVDNLERLDNISESSSLCSAERDTSSAVLDDQDVTENTIKESSNSNLTDNIVKADVTIQHDEQTRTLSFEDDNKCLPIDDVNTADIPEKEYLTKNNEIVSNSCPIDSEEVITSQNEQLINVDVQSAEPLQLVAIEEPIFVKKVAYVCGDEEDSKSEDKKVEMASNNIFDSCSLNKDLPLADDFKLSSEEQLTNKPIPTSSSGKAIAKLSDMELLKEISNIVSSSDEEVSQEQSENKYLMKTDVTISQNVFPPSHEEKKCVEVNDDKNKKLSEFENPVENTLDCATFNSTEDAKMDVPMIIGNEKIINTDIYNKSNTYEDHKIEHEVFSENAYPTSKDFVSEDSAISSATRIDLPPIAECSYSEAVKVDIWSQNDHNQEESEEYFSDEDSDLRSNKETKEVEEVVSKCVIKLKAPMESGSEKLSETCNEINESEGIDAIKLTSLDQSKEKITEIQIETCSKADVYASTDMTESLCESTKDLPKANDANRVEITDVNESTVFLNKEVPQQQNLDFALNDENIDCKSDTLPMFGSSSSNLLKTDNFSELRNKEDIQQDEQNSEISIREAKVFYEEPKKLIPAKALLADNKRSISLVEYLSSEDSQESTSQEKDLCYRNQHSTDFSVTNLPQKELSSIILDPTNDLATSVADTDHPKENQELLSIDCQEVKENTVQSIDIMCIEMDKEEDDAISEHSQNTPNTIITDRMEESITSIEASNENEPSSELSPSIPDFTESHTTRALEPSDPQRSTSKDLDDISSESDAEFNDISETLDIKLEKSSISCHPKISLEEHTQNKEIIIAEKCDKLSEEDKDENVLNEIINIEENLEQQTVEVDINDTTEVRDAVGEIDNRQVHGENLKECEKYESAVVAKHIIIESEEFSSIEDQTCGSTTNEKETDILTPTSSTPIHSGDLSLEDIVEANTVVSKHLTLSPKQIESHKDMDEVKSLNTISETPFEMTQKTYELPSHSNDSEDLVSTSKISIPDKIEKAAGNEMGIKDLTSFIKSSEVELTKNQYLHSPKEAALQEEQKKANLVSISKFSEKQETSMDENATNPTQAKSELIHSIAPEELLEKIDLPSDSASHKEIESNDEGSSNKTLQSCSLERSTFKKDSTKSKDTNIGSELPSQVIEIDEFSSDSFGDSESSQKSDGCEMKSNKSSNVDRVISLESDEIKSTHILPSLKILQKPDNESEDLYLQNTPDHSEIPGILSINESQFSMKSTKVLNYESEDKKDKDDLKTQPCNIRPQHEYLNISASYSRSSQAKITETEELADKSIKPSVGEQSTKQSVNSQFEPVANIASAFSDLHESLLSSSTRISNDETILSKVDKSILQHDHRIYENKTLTSADPLLSEKEITCSTLSSKPIEKMVPEMFSIDYTLQNKQMDVTKDPKTKIEPEAPAVEYSDSELKSNPNATKEVSSILTTPLIQNLQEGCAITPEKISKQLDITQIQSTNSSLVQNAETIKECEKIRVTEDLEISTNHSKTKGVSVEVNTFNENLFDEISKPCASTFSEKKLSNTCNLIKPNEVVNDESKQRKLPDLIPTQSVSIDLNILEKEYQELQTHQISLKLDQRKHEQLKAVLHEKPMPSKNVEKAKEWTEMNTSLVTASKDELKSTPTNISVGTEISHILPSPTKTGSVLPPASKTNENENWHHMISTRMDENKFMPKFGMNVIEKVGYSPLNCNKNSEDVVRPRSIDDEDSKPIQNDDDSSVNFDDESVLDFDDNRDDLIECNVPTNDPVDLTANKTRETTFSSVKDDRDNEDDNLFSDTLSENSDDDDNSSPITSEEDSEPIPERVKMISKNLPSVSKIIDLKKRGTVSPKKEAALRINEPQLTNTDTKAIKNDTKTVKAIKDETKVVSIEKENADVVKKNIEIEPETSNKESDKPTKNENASSKELVDEKIVDSLNSSKELPKVEKPIESTSIAPTTRRTRARNINYSEIPEHEQKIVTPSKPKAGPKGRGRKKNETTPPTNTSNVESTPKICAEIEKPVPLSSSKLDSSIKDDSNIVMEASTVEDPKKAIKESTNVVAPEKKSSPLKGRKRGRRIELELDKGVILDAVTDDQPVVRQSRRIAQIKIKEEAERRKEEEVALKKLKANAEKNKVGPKSPESRHSSPASKHEAESASDAESQKKKKPKKVKGKKDNPWATSESEVESEEHEEEDGLDYHVVSDHDSRLFKSDHEFSPESDIEDESEIVPTKRARTAKKETVDDSESEDDNPNHACQKCSKHDHPEFILLCDTCDKGYHCSCLTPVLFVIPEGDWFCPPCQHNQLILVLEQELSRFDQLLKEKELEEIRRQRLIFTNVDVANVLPQRKNRPKTTGNDDENMDDGADIEDDSENEVDTKSRRKRQHKKASMRNSDNSSSDDDSSGSNGSSSSASNTDSDEPIYKLRKRKAFAVSYRFNEYDDLINSAIKKEMDEVKGAGNLGRGKDISTIIEADKEEKRLKRLNESGPEEKKDVDSQVIENVEVKEEKPIAITVEGEDVDVPIGAEDDDDDEEVTLKKRPRISSDDSDSEPIYSKKKSKNKHLHKKKKKLNSLDISSEDDGSDEDFKTSSLDSEEEEDELISASSDSSLDMYRKRGKKHKGGSRRSGRERRRRFDRGFINDNSDNSDEEVVIKPKRKKKIDSDFSDFNENDSEDDEEEEEVDSEDLCDDSESEVSDGAWNPGKRKKLSVSKKRPSVPSTSGTSSTTKNRKKSVKKVEEGEKAFRVGLPKNKLIQPPDSDDDSDNRTGGRRTRGKRLTYILDDFESSDDGIKPGVKRPDTPPEEREKFIKRQEEIKRMLAAKNLEAAQALAVPKIELLPPPEILEPPLPDVGTMASEALSIIPFQVIQAAKALDVDLPIKRREQPVLLTAPPTSVDLGEDDLPEDFDPEDMNEDEIAKMMEEEDFAQQQLKLAGEAIRNKRIREAAETKGLKMDEVPKVSPVKISLHTETKKRGRGAKTSSITGKAQPATVIATPVIVPPIASCSLSTSGFYPQSASQPQHTMQPSVIHATYQTPPMIPTTVLAATSNKIPAPVGQTPQTEPMQLTTDLDEPKKRGRRKKYTPLRESLKPGIDMSSPSPPIDAKTNPLIADRLGVPKIAENKPILNVAAPPQLYSPGGSVTPSVIIRLPQSHRPPLMPHHQGPGPQRFYPPPSSHPPTALHGRPPPTHLHGNSGPQAGGHFIPSDFHTRHPSPHALYRPPPPGAIYGRPPGNFPPTSAGGAAGHPMQPINPNLRDDFPGAPPYSGAPFTNYYASSHPPQQPPPPISQQPQPSPPSQQSRPMDHHMRPRIGQFEQYDNVKHTPPHEEVPAPVYAVREEELPPTGTSEFSGLVSYFSSQQDDLES